MDTTNTNETEPENITDVSPRDMSTVQFRPLSTVAIQVGYKYANMPYQISGDASREYIGVFREEGSVNVQLQVPTSIGLGYINTPQDTGFVELRYASHGEMVRMPWILDSLNKGDCTLILITKEGNGV